MKHLFCVKNKQGKLITGGKGTGSAYFTSKQVAKGFRTELGGVEAGFHISKGPDHIGVHGQRTRKTRTHARRANNG